MSENELIDKTLGDFRLLRRLGIGGMAEVYLAEQISLHRHVAVKILQEDALGGKSGNLIKRFQQEARVAGGLSHPNIVQVFVTGQEGTLHYIVQEYVQGQNLSQWFKRYGPPDFLTGLKWMRQVASALRAADEAGIVHRDIKPENIMLNRAGDAKVTDFGLAQLNEVTKKMNLTQDGTTMGTPWYMSPEQIQGEKLDHRSDQYSFGVTCYHMFAGQPPFPGKNSVSIAVQHLKENARPLSEIRQDLPVELCAIIHRMMEKSPERRFQTPDELEKALERLCTADIRPVRGASIVLKNWMGSSLPSVPALLVGFIICGALAAAAGRQLYPSTEISMKPAGFPREATAQRQFARAALLGRNESAWTAVIDYHPMSDEALWARLQLGLLYLGEPRRDLVRADAVLQELISSAALRKAERSDVLFLAYLGRALIAEESGRDADRDDIVYNRLQPEFERQLRQELNAAPDVLLDYRDRLRVELGMMPNGRP
ncbi:MAG: serine/threonine protein kinase [Planctomycetaceae bacterium]|nr:serine/threonine protein kinase [Planctomycetaceae bacterium]